METLVRGSLRWVVSGVLQDEARKKMGERDGEGEGK